MGRPSSQRPVARPPRNLLLSTLFFAVCAPRLGGRRLPSCVPILRLASPGLSPPPALCPCPLSHCKAHAPTPNFGGPARTPYFIASRIKEETYYTARQCKAARQTDGGRASGCDASRHVEVPAYAPQRQRGASGGSRDARRFASSSPLVYSSLHLQSTLVQLPSPGQEGFSPRALPTRSLALAAIPTAVQQASPCRARL